MMVLMTSFLGQKRLLITLDKAMSFMAANKALALPLNSQLSIHLSTMVKRALSLMVLKIVT
jgi:hypothetical protein